MCAAVRSTSSMCWAPVVGDKPAVCVVMAAGGYPDSYEKGKVITGLGDAAKSPDVMVFHAGTAQRGGEIVTNGGRVLGVTALGSTLADAQARAYHAVDLIRWDKEYHRTDIAAKGLAYLESTGGAGS